MRHPSALAVSVFILCPRLAVAATLSVGPGQTYAMPCDAIAAAAAGDVIEVDASGSYDGDHCAWATDQLTVRGVNGRPKIDAGGLEANVAQDKGIFVITAPNATVENFELSGAVADPSSNNGAGIRHQGTNLTVVGCYFHDNQDGILGAPPTAGTGTVDIESSEFADNGAGDGYSHNMYLGDYAAFILNGSYSHGAKVGHLVKSRAYENHITYNRLTDEPGTTASYELDLPNGGTSYVIGNLIEQDPQSQNPIIVTYAEEGGTNPDQHLFFVNNTVVNDETTGTFLNVAVAQPPAEVVNNIFDGPGTVASQAGAVLTTNFVSTQMGDPLLVDPAAFDYQLQADSPCIDHGSDPGTGLGQPLAPVAEYVNPVSTEPRTVVGAAIDIGAYEYGNPSSVADGGAPPTDAGGVTAGDAGAPADGGAPATDAGVPAAGDAGAPAEDAGPLPADGGASAVSSKPNGCGCGASSAPGSWLVLLPLIGRRRRVARAQ